MIPSRGVIFEREKVPVLEFDPFGYPAGITKNEQESIPELRVSLEAKVRDFTAYLEDHSEEPWVMITDEEGRVIFEPARLKQEGTGKG